MKTVLKLVLGIVTGIAGFIEVGSLSTSAQAGALFGFRLLWAVALAAACLAALAEMAGRLAATSKHTVAASVRERLGAHFYAGPLLAEVVLDLLVLAAEIGGMAIAIQLLTAVGVRWWVLPAALLVWGLLWFGTFSVIEDGVALLGTVSLCFVVAVFRLDAPPAEVVRGLLPSWPPDHRPQYAFLAVSILGATISPYVLNFYSSGAVEEKWTEKDLWTNRITSVFGMGFGAAVSGSVLVVAGLVLHPRGIQVDSYEQAALMLVPPFGRWGVSLFAASLAIGCLGAALEIALNLAYAVSQASGWNWGKDARPKDDARFSLVYTLAVLASTAIVLTGVDPLRLTLLSMALTVVVLPFVVLPFLVFMNDERYLKDHTNGWLGNALVGLVVLGGFLMAIVAIPLQIMGG